MCKIGVAICPSRRRVSSFFRLTEGCVVNAGGVHLDNADEKFLLRLERNLFDAPDDEKTHI